jgi:hypothetical protein
MQNDNEIKKIVKEKYGQIAIEATACCGPPSCCRASTRDFAEHTVIEDEYIEIISDAEFKDIEIKK